MNISEVIVNTYNKNNTIQTSGILELSDLKIRKENKILL